MFASRARILLAFIQCYLKLCIIWAGPQDESQGSNPNSNFIVDFLYRHKVFSLFTKIVEFFFPPHFKISILNPSRYERGGCHPGGTSGKEYTSQDIRNLSPIPGLGRSPGGGHSNPLQYFCLENPMDRGACRLWSVGSQRVRHNWSNWACMPTYTKGRLWIGFKEYMTSLKLYAIFVSTNI